MPHQSPDALPSSRRPIIPGFHPDPSICRVGDDYYVANSSFEFFPGVPIWHSRDLVTWTRVGHVITRTSQFPAGEFRPSMGIYAPTLRHQDGLFYLITTAVEGEDGHLIFTADDAAGPWSDPVVVRGLGGFDPDLSWDDDGTCLVTYCGITDWIPQGIHQAAIDPTSGEVLEEPRMIWKGSGLQWPEGPHVYRRGEWWYLLIAEGGTDRGHVVTVARARSARGPFEGAPHNPIFTHRSTDHPVESTGHADLVERPDGSWAAVYLAVRSHGWVPKFHVNGRETFVAGIDWVDDWPVFVEDAFQVPASATSFDDDFSATELDGRWVSPGVALADIARPAEHDGLELQAVEAPSGTMSGLFMRPADRHWEARVEVETAGGAARVVLRMDERHWYAVAVGEVSAKAVVRIGDIEHQVGEAPIPPGTVVVVIRSVATAGRGPDDIVIGIEGADGAQTELARLDGRYLSMEVASGFTGRVLGVIAGSGTATVRRFSYESTEP